MHEWSTFVLKLCFGFSGRINRAKYWLAITFWINLLDKICVHLVPGGAAHLIIASVLIVSYLGTVAELVGIEGGVVSGVINLESSGVEASDWRPRHDEPYHEA